MASAAIERITELVAERAALYRSAGNGRRGDPALRTRLQAINGELEALWDLRRQERAGRREGVDLLVDRAYEHVYGRGYEETVSPPAVSEEDDEPVTLAA